MSTIVTLLPNVEINVLTQAQYKGLYIAKIIPLGLVGNFSAKSFNSVAANPADVAVGGVYSAVDGNTLSNLPAIEGKFSNCFNNSTGVNLSIILESL